VNPKLQPWLPFEKIQALIQLEPFLVIIGIALGSWISYKLFLKDVNEERHRNLQRLFKNLAFHLLIFCILFSSFFGLEQLLAEALDVSVQRILAYLGAMTLLAGCTVFVKTSRILVFEYLFLSHMRVGVPLLLINLCTLLLALTLGGYFIAEIFTIRVAPLLATSAIFSVVLGLALQDTLGNLFAGVAMQFDKPYQIGDWVEINSGPQKWVGQVYEISWRATTLLGLSDEIITFPNRTMSQAQVSNFSMHRHGIARGQVFKIPYSVGVARAREILQHAIQRVDLVEKLPTPVILVQEVNENWIQMKVTYTIRDYGQQWLIADEVLHKCLKGLEEAGVSLARPRLEIANANQS